MKSVLILGGNSTQALPLIYTLGKSNYNVYIITNSIFSSEFFSTIVRKRFIWKKGYESSEFLPYLKSILFESNIDYVIGMGDKSSRLLSRCKDAISKLCDVVVCDFDVFTRASDKYELMKFCMEVGIPCPRTYSVLEYKNGSFKTVAKKNYVVKPRMGVGSEGFKVLEGDKINDYISTFKNSESWLIQEYIDNRDQYTAEVFCNNQSDLLYVFISKKIRFFPKKGGTSCCNEAINNSKIIDVIDSLLKEIRWVGPANIDLIFDASKGDYKIIEINPRLGATIKIADDYMEDIVNIIFNKFPSESHLPSILTFKNKFPSLRNIPLEIIWLLFSFWEFKSAYKSGYFRIFAPDVFYESVSLKDPFTWLGYFFGLLKKFSSYRLIIKKFFS